MERKRIVIVFVGAKGSGKSEAAKFLQEEFGVRRTRFADPIKKMLMSGFNLELNDVDGGSKELPSSKLLNKTPRYAMMTLGTEWGRIMIGQDVWINAWSNTIPKHGPISVDDMRFPNEYDFVKNVMDGIVIRIHREGFNIDGSHASESHDLPYDFIIPNNGSIEDLNNMMASLYSKIAEKKIPPMSGL